MKLFLALVLVLLLAATASARIVYVPAYVPAAPQVTVWVPAAPMVQPVAVPMAPVRSIVVRDARPGEVRRAVRRGNVSFVQPQPADTAPAAAAPTALWVPTAPAPTPAK